MEESKAAVIEKKSAQQKRKLVADGDGDGVRTVDGGDEFIDNTAYHYLKEIAQVCWKTQVFGDDEKLAAKWVEGDALPVAPSHPALAFVDEGIRTAVKRLHLFEMMQRIIKRAQTAPTVSRRLRSDRGLLQRWLFSERMWAPPKEWTPFFPAKPEQLDVGLLSSLVNGGVSTADTLVVSERLVKFSVDSRRQLAAHVHKQSKAGSDTSDLEIKMCICYRSNMRRLSVADIHIEIHESHYVRLRALYSKHTENLRRSTYDDKSNNSDKTVFGREMFRVRELRFVRRLWAMLMRYKTLGGLGYQGAVPPDAMKVLETEFGCTHECFASPLNHQLDSFGSAFMDVDRHFGSTGAFLQQRVTEGSFQCNPPFVESIMATSALHIVAQLAYAQTIDNALSFVVVWPGWKDTPGFTTLSKSVFLRKMMVLESGKHQYQDGAQQKYKCGESSRVARFKTHIFFMQTDAAALRWPVTSRNEQRLRLGFSASPPQQRKRRKYKRKSHAIAL